MNLQKLQRVIVDALEDVKAQDIRIFDTGRLTSLFDRVVVASGTSNRQTRALAANVRDKVKEAGGFVISVEGEDTGEWVLVDAGDVVVHIMQPAIRQYYNLEEIWGGKPVRVRLGAATGRAAVAGAGFDVDDEAEAGDHAMDGHDGAASRSRGTAASEAAAPARARRAGPAVALEDRDGAATDARVPTRKPAARKSGSAKSPPVIGVAPKSPISGTRAPRSPASKAASGGRPAGARPTGAGATSGRSASARPRVRGAA